MMMAGPGFFDQPLVQKIASSNNYNQKTDHSQTFASRARTIINVGTFIGSSSTGLSSYVVGSGWPVGTKVELWILGEIQGRGGAGGNGASIDDTGGVITVTASATAGEHGGPGLDATGSKIRIFSSGAIRGGNGGGGGGGAGAGGGGVTGSCGGSGGGGGRGTPGGAAGSAGNGTTDSPAIDGGVANNGLGNNGSSGTSSTNGAGGATMNRPSPMRAQGGAGGDGGTGAGANAGGSAGRSGVAGDWDRGSAGANSGGAVGGAAGACITGNSNIEWIATGTREGSIS